MFSLPCDKCKGKCCTYPVFSPEEFNILRILKGVPQGATVMPMQHEQSYDPQIRRGDAGFVIFKPDGVCPYLIDGKCSIYNLRPKVCRDYGVVPDLPCEYLYPEAAAKKQNDRIANSRV